MSKPTGYLIYDGPSQLDGQRIVAVAVVKSRNRKTSDMVQTFIMRYDVAPHTALQTGDDASVCGNCPHRGAIVDGKNVGRTCYVVVVQAPLSVWRKMRRGGYPTATAAEVAELVAGRPVRLGTYGDPAAVPVDVWEDLTSRARKTTGYTHQWATAPQLQGLCMASVDSADEAVTAAATGWRYFRVAKVAELLPREISCPASDEAGKRSTCERCGLCNGARVDDGRKNIVIMAHGPARGRMLTVQTVR